MLVVHVHIHVKEEYLDDFIRETLLNARGSVQEAGIARFDVVQQSDDPTRFVLIEVYHDDVAQGRHKETDHYGRWRDRVAEMMAEPRGSVKYRNIFPDNHGW